MPTYEYKCEDCGNHFEETHGMDHRVEKCPSCGGEVRRLFHPVGIIFKGSGFYKTDYGASSDNGGKSTSGKVEKEPEKVTSDSSKDKEEGSQKSAKEAGSSS